PDDRAVAAADVGGIDRNVEHVPRRIRFLVRPGFLDRVLVRTAERGEDEFARIRLARGDIHAGAALVHLPDLVDVREVQFRVDALRVEIQRDHDDIQISSTFAVAEEGAFDALGAGQHAEFGGGDPGAAVVVRVQRHDGAVPPREVPAHPFDLVSVHVGRRVFDRGRQVQDDLVVRRRLPDVGNRLADLQGEFEFGARETLRRVFQPQIGAAGDQGRRVLFEQVNRVGGDLHDRRLLCVEHVPALGGRRGVVEVEDDVLRALERFAGADNHVLPALAKDLDGDIIGNAVFLDQAAAEIELDLRRGRETDFDLLEADLHQHVEELELLGHVHRLGQGLV